LNQSSIEEASAYSETQYSFGNIEPIDRFAEDKTEMENASGIEVLFHRCMRLQVNEERNIEPRMHPIKIFRT